ncbi:MAG: DUF5676 family membrane protein [Minisyncoccota bacterium]
MNKKAFANAMGAVTALVYAVFWILQMVAPAAFNFVWNAQFMGADMAALVGSMSFSSFIGVLIAMGVMGWVMGWLIAHFYNKFSK